jgi:archaellum component FlaG (FlaF/FlaG flagellin family)
MRKNKINSTKKMNERPKNFTLYIKNKIGNEDIKMANENLT